MFITVLCIILTINQGSAAFIKGSRQARPSQGFDKTTFSCDLGVEIEVLTHPGFTLRGFQCNQAKARQVIWSNKVYLKFISIFPLTLKFKKKGEQRLQVTTDLTFGRAGSSPGMILTVQTTTSIKFIRSSTEPV